MTMWQLLHERLARDLISCLEAITVKLACCDGEEVAVQPEGRGRVGRKEGGDRILRDRGFLIIDDLARRPDRQADLKATE